MFKKTVLSNFASALLLVGALAAGTAQAQEPAKPELRVGFVPGPYIDEFKVGVAPELQKKGYRIRYVEFSTGLEANNAVFKGEIDANVMQHTIFLNSYNERQGPLFEETSVGHADQGWIDGCGAQRSRQSATRSVGAARSRSDRDSRQ